MDAITFSFSDTIAGYVLSYDKETDSFRIKTSDGREFTAKFAPNSYAWTSQYYVPPSAKLLRNAEARLRRGPN